MTTTNHKLNVQAAEAVGWKIGGQKIRVGSPGTKYEYLYCNGKAWSPATSIEHAMDLLDLLTEDEQWGWSVHIDAVSIWRGEGGEMYSKPFCPGYSTPKDRPCAITEAFVAAKKAEASG